MRHSLVKALNLFLILFGSSVLAASSTVNLGANPAGGTSAATGGQVVLRDANGNAQFSAIGMTHVSAGIDNIGVGETSGSASALYPFLMQRTNATPIIMQLANPSTSAGAGAKIQLSVDAGGQTGEIGLFASATASPAAYSGGRMTVRCTDSCPGVSYVSDGAATGNHKFYAGGNAAGNLLVTIDQYGMQFTNAAAQPSCVSGLRGMLYFKQAANGASDTLEMCMKAAANTYGWVVVKTAP
jgi:hypothetical protein